MSAPELTPQEIEFLNSIFDMARENKIQAIASLLDQGIPVDLTDAKGDTLLILAAYHEHQELVQLLVSRGANLNALNDRGQTPLSCSVFRNNLPITKVLLDAGADSLLGAQTAPDIAEMFGNEEMKKLLETSTTE